MRRFTISPVRGICLAILAASCGASVAAEGGATKAEAEAMVKKGVAYIKAHGPDKSYEEISKKGSMFSDRDLYLVVYGLDGFVFAHGANTKMIGRGIVLGVEPKLITLIFTSGPGLSRLSLAESRPHLRHLDPRRGDLDGAPERLQGRHHPGKQHRPDHRVGRRHARLGDLRAARPVDDRLVGPRAVLAHLRRCAIGGVLGVMYTMPLRRALVSQSDLPYPEGVAAAEVLKVGMSSRSGALEGKAGLWAVIWGSIASALFAAGAAAKLLAAEVSVYFKRPARAPPASAHRARWR
jgi:hypothetical protein